MPRHPRRTEPTTPRRASSRRFLRLGSLVLATAAITLLGELPLLEDGSDPSGGPRFRTTEQPATALGPLVGLP